MSELSKLPYEVRLPDMYVGGNDPVNDILDVFVEFPGGQRWVGSFVTFDRMHSILEEAKRTGEFANGTYFWITDMILIERNTPELIHAAIRDLLDRERFEEAFLYCDPAMEDDYEIYDPPIQVSLTEENKRLLGLLDDEGEDDAPA